MRTSKARFRLCIGTFIIMTMVLGACISTSSEPEIEATRVLSPVVDSGNGASDVTVLTDTEDGATLYQANCAPCHGDTGLGDGPAAASITCEMPNFTLRPAEVTLEAWINAITNGTRQPPDPSCPMPPWGNRLNETQIHNVAQYVYDFSESSEVVVEGGPQETEEPSGDETEIVDDTGEQGSDGVDEPQATEEPEPTEVAEAGDDTDIIEMFTLTGTVVNGTAGAAIPDDLPIELIILDAELDGDTQTEPFEVYADEVQIQDDGSFTFSNVPKDGSVLSVQTSYGGLTQRATPIIVADISEDIVDFEFTIYEVTDDPAAVRIKISESFVDAVSLEGVSEIIQYIVFSNTGDKIFYQSAGYSTEISVPQGTINAFITAYTPIFGQMIESSPDRFLSAETDEGIVLSDTQPLLPGDSTDQIVGFYTIPYSGSMTVTQRYFYEVDELVVNASADRDLQLASEQLVPSGTRTLQGTGITYNSFTTNTPFPTNTDLTYRISDGPNSVSTVSTDTANPTVSDDQSFLQENSTFILGLGILLIVAGSIYLFYDLQKTRILAQAHGGGDGESKYQSEDDLIDAIAELDEAFEKGKLDEEDYQIQRTKLKDRLVKMRLDE